MLALLTGKYGLNSLPICMILLARESLNNPFSVSMKINKPRLLVRYRTVKTSSPKLELEKTKGSSAR